MPATQSQKAFASQNQLTVVSLIKRQMPKLLVQKVVSGSQVSQGRRRCVAHGTQLVHKLVAQFSQAWCVMQTLRPWPGVHALLQHVQQSMKTGARLAHHSWKHTKQLETVFKLKTHKTIWNSVFKVKIHKTIWNCVQSENTQDNLKLCSKWKHTRWFESLCSKSLATQLHLTHDL